MEATFLNRRLRQTKDPSFLAGKKSQSSGEHLCAPFLRNCIILRAPQLQKIFAAACIMDFLGSANTVQFLMSALEYCLPRQTINNRMANIE